MRSNDQFGKPESKPDQPIELVPETDEDELHDMRVYHAPRKTRVSGDDLASHETFVDGAPPAASNGDAGSAKGDPASTRDPMGEAIQWALDSLHQPAMAAADWLARDIDPKHSTAVTLLTDPNITLAQIRQAKSVFKTMRIVGEKAADRRIGARMYAAAIAAGLVRFGKKVSTQSDEALTRGFQGLLEDRRMPEPLRDLAGTALCMLKNMKGDQMLPIDQPLPRSKSA
jgi:hypothetical protein